MNIFDIMGPVMIGPSSSHTAGAARIGLITRHLLGCRPAAVELVLHGSFAATGKGHGTDRALVAGLLGMRPDDIRIPRAFALAREAGMEVKVSTAVLRGAHPNTVLLRVRDSAGRQMEVDASSLGGGRVRVNAIDGLEATFTGDYPTLIIRNEDKPGIVSEVTSLLSRYGANIATMQLYRDRRGGLAVMVMEFDEGLPPELIPALSGLSGVVRCTYLDMEEN